MTKTLSFVTTILISFLLPINFASAKSFDKFPKTFDKKCKNGKAKLYDECSDQIPIFQEALKQAKKSNKTLLISYGAEWCIWCHILEAYIEGKKTKFDYVFGKPDKPDARFNTTFHEREKYDVTKEAKALNDFVKNNFVVVHIVNYKTTNGNSVLKKTGAEKHYADEIPFVFTVKNDGQYSGHIEIKEIQVKRKGEDFFYGLDRIKLLNHLQRIKQLALP